MAANKELQKVTGITDYFDEEEWDETFEDEGMYDNQRFNNIEYFDTFIDEYNKRVNR